MCLSGGFKGGALGRQSPSLSNFFLFLCSFWQIFFQIISLHSLLWLVPPLLEILDQPLASFI